SVIPGPSGYANEASGALAWLSLEVPPDGSPKYLLLARRRWLASELGRLDEAESLARQALAVAVDDPDQMTARSHAVFCYSHLCEVAHIRRDWQSLKGMSAVGEELGRQGRHRLDPGEFLMWHGALARA